MRLPWVTPATPKESVLDYPWELYDLRNDWTQYGKDVQEANCVSEANN